jgi:hypothetical protein
MRRNSGYTANRAKAAWSLLLQAFNGPVNSVEDAPTDNPFSPNAKNISEHDRFCRPLAPITAKENKLRMISSKKDRRNP